MTFGIAKNVRSEVRECTPALFNQTLDSPHVARVCAEIEDALEAHRRGELTQDEFETIKARLKKRLPIFTFHALFKNGRRKNEDAVPSGLCIYDLDHIPNPQVKWAEIEPRKEELGILLSHISPSLEGLRLVFVMPAGATLSEAQAWMAQQLGDTQYDASVKDYARCSFAVPREYVLFMDKEGLFLDRTQRHGDTEDLSAPAEGFPEPTPACHPERSEGSECTHLNTSTSAFQTLRDAQSDTVGNPSEINNLCDSVSLCSPNNYPETYENIPYSIIVETLEEQMGGRPEHGSRNNFIFSMACHLRYVTNDDPNWIARILADIRQRDKENLLREKEWKKEMQSKGANKDKRHRPEGLVIQEIDPDMTNAAFVQRLADAEGRFLYTKMNEIDQFDALKTSARSKAHFQIMCLAFDPGNVYGQTRIGTGSVSERVCIRFNWNASTTIQKGQSYFQSVLTDGPISRINFCTIPERPIGSEMPVYGTYDAAFDEELKPYIDRLNSARGCIDCRPARQLAKKLIEECADFARLSESRVYENLSFRANVIAYLKACILYVAHGEQWDRTMEDFIRWSLRYDLWCKMKFFGSAIQQVDESYAAVRKSGPQNLLDLLPDEFTREEALQMRHRQGIRQGGVQAMLDNWRKRGYIQVVGEPLPKDIATQRFAKTATYLKDHPSVGQSVN